MSTKILFPLALLLSFSAAVFSAGQSPANKPSPVELPSEKHLRNVRQMTDGGENAEAYFSGGGDRLNFQSKRDEAECDQIYTVRADGSEVRMVSTGKGRTTCSYNFPLGGRILYSSTHMADAKCPTPPDYSRGYVWAVYPSFDIFTARE